MLKIEKTEFKVSGGMPCRIKRCGPVTKAVISSKTFPKDSCVKKLDKDRWMDKRTGEIREYEHGQTRIDNRDGVKKTMKKIRDIINCNVTEPSRVRWVTLTYAENMTDEKKLYKDYDAFRKRLYRYCEKKMYGKPEYISVVEPQGRGAWHVHAFFIWEKIAPFILNEELAKIWGHGFVKITALDNVDNPGAYFTAYLTDLPIDEAMEKKEGGEIKTGTDGKKYVKGARIGMYPVGMNIYRHSKGIKKPEIIECKAEDMEKKIHLFGPEVYRESYSIADNERIINRVQIIEYNKKRRIATYTKREI